MNIFEIKESMQPAGDAALDYILLCATLQKRDISGIREVFIEPLPKKLRDKLEGRVAMKACYHNTWMACYHNTWMALAKLPLAEIASVRYVLGYWHYSAMPVEHCFLKIGDKYHDPAGEMLLGSEETRYFAETELKVEDVKQCAEFAKKHFGAKYYIGPLEWHMFKKRGKE